MRLAALFAVLCAPATIAAADWPQWGGPTRDSISPEKGLLAEWPDGGPELLWQAKGLGPGYASVSISGDTIFTMGDRGDEEFIIALARDGGKERWRAKVGGNWGDGGPRCTPAVSGGLVYALSPHGDLACFEAAGGKERWRKSLKEDFGGKMMSGWGYSESPLVDGDRLVCTPGGDAAGIVALEKETGKEVWRAETPGLGGAGYSSIVVSEACGVRQYVQLFGKGVAGIRASDGKLLWKYRKVANGTANISTPVVTGDLVFASTAYGAGSVLLKLEKDGDGVTAKEVWFLDAGKFQNHHGGVVLVDGHIYGGHGQNAGNPKCVELATGKIAWQERGPGGGSAAVACADGRVYFRYDDGVVALLEATPAAYRLKGKFSTARGSGPAWPHPVIAGGKLYLRWADILLCYDIAAR